MEVQIGMIAKGQADKDAVVAHALEQFRQKFLFFVAKVARMDALFEASFSPLASSGTSPAFVDFSCKPMRPHQKPTCDIVCRYVRAKAALPAAPASALGAQAYSAAVC